MHGVWFYFENSYKVENIDISTSGTGKHALQDQWESWGGSDASTNTDTKSTKEDKMSTEEQLKENDLKKLMNESKYKAALLALDEFKYTMTDLNLSFREWVEQKLEPVDPLKEKWKALVSIINSAYARSSWDLNNPNGVDQIFGDFKEIFAEELKPKTSTAGLDELIAIMRAKKVDLQAKFAGVDLEGALKIYVENRASGLDETIEEAETIKERLEGET